MENNNFREQLNKEIDNIEIREEVFSNIMREMRAEKAKKLEKKPLFQFNARMKQVVALCSIAIIMVIAIPSLQNSGATPAPINELQPRMQYTLDNSVEVEINKLQKTARNFDLPMNYINEYKPLCSVMKDTNGEVVSVTTYQQLADKSYITINIAKVTKYNKMQLQGEVSKINGDKVAFMKLENSQYATYSMEVDNQNYYINTNSAESEKIALELVEEITKMN